MKKGVFQKLLAGILCLIYNKQSQSGLANDSN